MAYLCFRSQASLATGEIIYSSKNVSIAGCMYQFENTTKPEPTFDEMEKSFHHISYLYFTLFGTFVSCLVGSVVSLVKKSENEELLNQQLLAPFIRKYLSEKCQPAEQRELTETMLEKTVHNDIHRPE